MIISYKKHFNAVVNRELECLVSQELATVDGVTYVYVPDDVKLGTQAPEIAPSISVVEMNEELRKCISNASPLVKFIHKLVADKISSRYSIQDELKLIRTKPSTEFDEYNTFVEECRAWGRAEKAKIGL